MNGVHLIVVLFLFLQSSIAKGPLVLYISSFVITLVVKKFNKVVGIMVRDDFCICTQVSIDIVSIPYSGKFSLVQIFAEKRPDSPEEIFAVFIFADAGRSGHTLPVDGHAPYAKQH